MVVLDDVENTKFNSRYFDLEAITLNKVAANINSFTVVCMQDFFEVCLELESCRLSHSEVVCSSGQLCVCVGIVTQ